MKTGLYEPVEFNTRLSVTEAASCLQKEEAFDLRQWRCEVQDGRFAIVPVVRPLYAKHRFFWPEAYGSLTAHGSGTTVRLAFHPTAEGWVAWVFAILCLLGLTVFAVTTGWLPAILACAGLGAFALFAFCLMARNAKKAVTEKVKQALGVET